MYLPKILQRLREDRLFSSKSGPCTYEFDDKALLAIRSDLAFHTSASGLTSLRRYNLLVRSSGVGNPEDSDRLTDLMILYQKGDLEAFEELYRILKAKLYRYLVSLTLNPVEAEELLQETFLQMHRSRRTYQPRRPAMPWAFAISRHVFLMHRRSRLRRQKYLDEAPEYLDEIPIFPDAERLAEKELIRKALGQLSLEQREPLLLHHVWGFSLREIGGMLGIRRGTAKLRVYRGMLTLRHLLGINK